MTIRPERDVKPRKIRNNRKRRDGDRKRQENETPNEEGLVVGDLCGEVLPQEGGEVDSFE
jgi:hypothetical protein